jgi:hypothetical protein
MDFREAIYSSVRKVKTTLFTFSRAKVSHRLLRYISSHCERSENRAFSFSLSKSPFESFARESRHRRDSLKQSSLKYELVIVDAGPAEVVLEGHVA